MAKKSDAGGKSVENGAADPPETPENSAISDEKPAESTEITEESELFSWCRDHQARIVFGELRSGKRFCRVTVNRNLSVEKDTFAEAAGKVRSHYERLRAPREHYLRQYT